MPSVSNSPLSYRVIGNLAFIDNEFVSDGAVLFHKDEMNLETPAGYFNWDELKSEMRVISAKELRQDARDVLSAAIDSLKQLPDSAIPCVYTPYSHKHKRLWLTETPYSNEYTKQKPDFILLNMLYWGYWDFQDASVHYIPRLEGVIIDTKKAAGAAGYRAFLKVMKLDSESFREVKPLAVFAKLHSKGHKASLFIRNNQEHCAQ